MRPNRSELFLQVARLFATRSTCTRGQVGVVAVQGGRIVATGYNGSPPKAPHCTDLECDMSAGEEAGCQRAIHAEANMVAWAARHGASLEGAVVYSTHSACLRCAQLLVSAGISQFVFIEDYRAARLDIFAEGGVMVIQFR